MMNQIGQEKLLENTVQIMKKSKLMRILKIMIFLVQQIHQMSLTRIPLQFPLFSFLNKLLKNTRQLFQVMEETSYLVDIEDFKKRLQIRRDYKIFIQNFIKYIHHGWEPVQTFSHFLKILELRSALFYLTKNS